MKGDEFGDDDHQRYPVRDGIEGGREHTGRRYDDHRRIDGRLFHHLGYRVINGHAVHLGAFPTRGYATDDPDVIF
jgi:hypothetical protein